MSGGRWSSHKRSNDFQEDWDEPRVSRSDVSSEAFMEELCTTAGGYGRFFWTLTMHYFGWWAAVVAVPALFLDHHRCEVRMPWVALFLYIGVVVAMLAMAVLLELSMVQRLGLLQAGELKFLVNEAQWRLPLVTTVLWKLDAYTDVVFIFIARDCGSSLWWASLATFVFGIVFGQLLFNTCFACTDCDRELPHSFGFVLLDFKLVNTAVKQVLPFDPDASNLPVARPVTLRTTSHLIGMEKAVGDIAQVCIQVLFLSSAKYAHGFVVFSVIVGIVHGVITIGVVLQECVQDEYSVQAQGLQMGTALQPGAGAAPAPLAMPPAKGAERPRESAAGSSAVGPSSVGRTFADRERASAGSWHDGQPAGARGGGMLASEEEVDLL